MMFRRDEARVDLCAGRGYGYEIDEFPPVFIRLLAIGRNRKKLQSGML